MGNCGSVNEKRKEKGNRESQIQKSERNERDDDHLKNFNIHLDKRISSTANFTITTSHNMNNRESTAEIIERNSMERKINSTPFKIARNKSLTQNRIESKIFQKEFDIVVNNSNIFNEKDTKPFESYDLVKKVGSGSYGSVFLVNHKQMNLNRAMKKIKKEELNSPDEDIKILDEVNILQTLDHPNILKIFELYNSRDAYYYITEYCNKGELLGFLKKKYTPVQISVMFYQILLAIHYLHCNNITHRDLKLENILISHIDEKGFLSIKIIDFGGAKIFQNNKKEKAIIGSSYYIAPEVIKMNYNEKCDEWGCGVILYMLLVGIPPFNDRSDEIILEKILSGNFNKTPSLWLRASKQIKDLIQRLLDTNIETRLSARDALDHEWFKINKTREILTEVKRERLLNLSQNIINYRYESKLQQVTLLFIIHNFISENVNEELPDALKMFRLFDSDLDGKLTKEELIEGLKLSISEEEIKEKIDELFLTIDAGHSGFIRYEEFLCAVLSKNKIISEDNLYFAFKYFDKTNSGRITIEELKEILRLEDDELSREVLGNIIKDMDSVGNGVIDFFDFKNMMRNLVNQ